MDNAELGSECCEWTDVDANRAAVAASAIVVPSVGRRKKVHKQGFGVCIVCEVDATEEGKAAAKTAESEDDVGQSQVDGLSLRHGFIARNHCASCGFWSHSSRLVEDHIKSMHGYVCEVEQCKKTFATKELLASHKIVHTIRYCAICNLTTSAPDRVHVKSKQHERALRQRKIAIGEPVSYEPVQKLGRARSVPDDEMEKLIGTSEIEKNDLAKEEEDELQIIFERKVVYRYPRGNSPHSPKEEKEEGGVEVFE